MANVPERPTGKLNEWAVIDSTDRQDSRFGRRQAVDRLPKAEGQGCPESTPNQGRLQADRVSR